jgi:carbon-monoxide dehydrogenase small subunit
MGEETVTVSMTVNGQRVTVEVEPRDLLSDVLRSRLGLTGVHAGCEHGVCGSCTVLRDGRPVRSCLTFAVQAEGWTLTTVEGLGSPGHLDPVQEALWQAHGLQCGYCTPGMALTAKAFLAENPHPTAEEVRDALSGNLCRCTGYQFIVEAVLRAAGGDA